jgi:phosphate transport system substrate-binding protein
LNVHVRRLAPLLAIALTAAACAGGAVPVADPLAGDYLAASAESAVPVAQRLTDAFAKKHPGMAWKVKDVGSGAALALVASGDADAGFLSREATIDDRDQAVVIGLGYTAQVIIVHPANPVTGLSQEQLRGIFSGTVKDWREVGGTPGPILVVIRADSSPTRTALDPLLRAPGGAYRQDAISAPDADSMVNTVTAAPRAIGMVSAPHLGVAAGAPRPIAVDGIAPTRANVASGTYAYRRAVSLVFRANASVMRPGARAFRDFVHGEDGQRILREIF